MASKKTETKTEEKGQGEVNNSAMTVIQPSAAAVAPVSTAQLMQWSPQDVVHHVTLIHEVMKAVMKDGTHYGTIPGCGDKPSLFLPGAETICMTFRLAPKYQIGTLDMPGGHREYRVTCELYHIVTGNFIGSGVGTACTMEGKWRFKSGPVTFTGKPVPKDYWNVRETDPKKAIELLGGRGHSAKKNPDSGMWEIVEKGEAVEHDNPADFYNTAMKIAAKRAFTSAAKGSTAASDIFTVDLEDLPQDMRGTPEPVQQDAQQGKAADAGTGRAATGTTGSTGAQPAKEPLRRPETVKLRQDEKGNPQVVISFSDLKATEKKRKSDGKPYTLYTLKGSDGMPYVTIMRDTALLIQEAWKAKEERLVTYAVNKFDARQRDVLAIAKIDPGSGTVTTPEPGEAAGQDNQGSAAADDSGRDDEGAERAFNAKEEGDAGAGKYADDPF